MEKQVSPFQTPDGFFEAQRTAIWQAAEQPSEKVAAPVRSLPSWWAWVASSAALLALTIYWNVQTHESECATFACLWESTPEDARVPSDEEVELWLEDDLLFESILPPSIDV